MIEEREFIDSINYRDTGHIEVRRVSQVLKDGVELARSYHRWVVSPGDDLTGQDPKIVTMAEAFWTDELIEAYRAKLATSEVLPP